MNTNEEIRQVYNDYYIEKFGHPELNRLRYNGVTGKRKSGMILTLTVT